eukprot:TRINITY_DN1386_c1_g1_i1.p1 TRINITY_DN1386_c1_g1~~TRINITY_DN1386_c1_g1_i1.p1  ORF type:complete len:212 (-),score=88.08 TRINITY_DN1386_c1_g1_i1:320-955(-)
MDNNEKVCCLVIGIAGGSGSGKTTIADAILSKVGFEHIAFLHHDSYYRDLTTLTLEQRAKVNFDHPDSLETELLVEHVKALKRGETIQIPIYDFKTHSRTTQFLTQQPKKIIVVEGILVLAEKELREQMDLKIFVDCDADLRFIRRQIRDIEERGRNVHSIIDQYLTTVRPMHNDFVEPSKRYAHVIIPEGINEPAIALVSSHVESMLSKM